MSNSYIRSYWKYAREKCTTKAWIDKKLYYFYLSISGLVSEIHVNLKTTKAFNWIHSKSPPTF